MCNNIIKYIFRFNDIHVPVRLECVKFASHCLMNHPDLAKDLTGMLCVCVCVYVRLHVCVCVCVHLCALSGFTH